MTQQKKRNAPLSLAAALLVCFVLLSATVASASAKRIALVYDADDVDIDEEEDREDWGEASNLRAFVESLGYHPYLITENDNEASWNNTLAQARTVIFPENAGTVPSNSVAHIRAWVRQGGVAVFVESTDDVARQLTGLALAPASEPITRGTETWARTDDGAASSLFANGPAQVEAINSASTWYLSGDLPDEAASLKCMYGSTANCAVWVYAQGSGRWIGVAPDFYNFGYAGGQDGGWVSVMTSIAGYGSSSSASQLTSWAAALVAAAALF